MTLGNMRANGVRSIAVSCFFRPQRPANIESCAKADSYQNAPFRCGCSHGHLLSLVRGYHQGGNDQIARAALERGNCQDRCTE
jgi:hypothetical protein